MPTTNIRRYSTKSRSKEKDLPQIKCVLVGDGGVGKTCLLISYALQKFPTEYIPTVYENYEIQINIDQNPDRDVSESQTETYKLAIYDTAGQEDYDRVRVMCYPDTHIFIVCFSIINPASFGNVKTRWLPELKHYNPGVPFILVGTMADLKENGITRRQGEELAREIGAVKYIECSAICLENVRVGLLNR